MGTGIRFFSVALADSKAHLAAAQETYLQHMRFAASVGALLAAAGIACTLHAIIPSLCTSTASRTIRRLNRLLEDRDSLPEALRDTSEALGFAFLLASSFIAAASLWLSGAGPAVALPLSLVALGLPAALIASNPGLERREDAQLHA
mgnify:CR=1 FL=1